MDHYAVLGNPISHSQSPRIHAAFARHTGEKLEYAALEVPLGGFEKFVGELHLQGYKGMNVTVPFKLDAFTLAETLSERARLAGAVNTLQRSDSGWSGDNTDGVGLLTDLQQNAAVKLGDKRILLLGAGGAVRGVVAPLLQAAPACLLIANRTAAKAQTLASEFRHLGNVSSSGLSLASQDGFDVVINGTAASLSGDMPELPDSILADGAFCYDMMYAATPTVFLRWAEQRGAATRDGLGMLVEQAAESFRLWRGVRPQTQAVLAELRAALRSKSA